MLYLVLKCDPLLTIAPNRKPNCHEQREILENRKPFAMPASTHIILVLARLFARTSCANLSGHR